jgi:hypothetical protein
MSESQHWHFVWALAGEIAKVEQNPLSIRWIEFARTRSSKTESFILHFFFISD